MTENLPNNHKDKGDIYIPTRYHCFTLNNYTKEEEIEFQEYIKDKKDYIQYCIYSHEIGERNGTPHLQGGIITFKKIRPSTLKNKIGLEKLHIEKCKKNFLATYRYCIKPKNKEEELNKLIWEFPEPYEEMKEKNKKLTREDIINLAKEGKYDDIPFAKRVLYHRHITTAISMNIKSENLFLRNRFNNYFKTFNVLLWGKTGTGKTYRVDLITFAINKCFEKHICPNLKLKYKELKTYDKLQNKYWDDYMGEEIVVIEEVRPEWFQAAESNLKRWLDSKPFKVEVKGSSLPQIRPLFFILTSNYSLLELCSLNNEKFNPQKLLYPMEQRLNCINVTSKEQNINFPDYQLLYNYYKNINTVKMEHFLNQKSYVYNLESNPKFIEELKKDDQLIIQNNEPIELNAEPPSERESDTNQENSPILISDSEPVIITNNYLPLREEQLKNSKDFNNIMNPNGSVKLTYELPRLGKRGIDWEYTENLPGYPEYENKKQKNNSENPEERENTENN